MRPRCLFRSDLFGLPQTSGDPFRLVLACIAFMMATIALGHPELLHGQASQSPAAASAAGQAPKGFQAAQSPPASARSTAAQPKPASSTAGGSGAGAPSNQPSPQPAAKLVQGTPAAGSQLNGNRLEEQAQPTSPRQQIDAECANLLKMANDLKAEVDKTTKDELSIAVVRKANAIEQLAHKVRDDMKPAVAGKN